MHSVLIDLIKLVYWKKWTPLIVRNVLLHLTFELRLINLVLNLLNRGVAQLRPYEGLFHESSVECWVSQLCNNLNELWVAMLV